MAEAEQIGITEEEKEGEYLRIAEQCGMDVARVKAAADAEAVKWQLLRDKARQLIFAHCKPAG